MIEKVTTTPLKRSVMIFRKIYSVYLLGILIEIYNDKNTNLRSSNFSAPKAKHV